MTGVTSAYTLGYQYDLADGMTNQTFPSGRIVKFGHQRNGRLASITGKKSILSSDYEYPYVSTFGYTPGGSISGVSYGNTATSNFTYNGRQQVSSATINPPSTTR